MEDKWISVKERNPTKVGWYVIRSKDEAQYRAPFIRNFTGYLDWLIPDPNDIVYWLEQLPKPPKE